MKPTPYLPAPTLVQEFPPRMILSEAGSYSQPNPLHPMVQIRVANYLVFKKEKSEGDLIMGCKHMKSYQQGAGDHLFPLSAWLGETEKGFNCRKRREHQGRHEWEGTDVVSRSST